MQKRQVIEGASDIGMVRSQDFLLNPKRLVRQMLRLLEVSEIAVEDCQVVEGASDIVIMTPRLLPDGDRILIEHLCPGIVSTIAVEVAQAIIGETEIGMIRIQRILPDSQRLMKERFS